MTIYWKAPSGMRKAEVPGGTRAFQVGAKCWHCPAHSVRTIDWRQGYYECAAGHRHDIPERHARIDGRDFALELIERGRCIERIEGAQA
jgi:hypothetical protein